MKKCCGNCMHSSPSMDQTTLPLAQKLMSCIETVQMVGKKATACKKWRNKQ